MPSLRPSEIIFNYLENASFRDDPAAEMRLPTIRDLAEKLGVGVSTVGAAYRTLAKQGRIRTEVGNGSFLLPAAPSARGREMRIGIGLSSDDLADPQSWHSCVYGGITLASLKASQPMSLMPLDLEQPDVCDRVKRLNGLIVMPGRLLYQPLVDAAREAGIPAVYLHPPKVGETTNFVSADFAGASERLGEAFLASGRKHILLLLSDPWHVSISAHYRLSGLLAGLQFGSGNGVTFRIEVAHGFDVASGRRALARILDEGGSMDAIYASGDFLAMGCVEELEARGRVVPNEVSVIGGSGLDLTRYSHPGLTCCAQPYEQIGLEIMAMIRRLVETRVLAVPGVVVPMRWTGGTTTLAPENQILMA